MVLIDIALTILVVGLAVGFNVAFLNETSRG
jgi:hypothetical protein